MRHAYRAGVPSGRVGRVSVLERERLQLRVAVRTKVKERTRRSEKRLASQQALDARLTRLEDDIFSVCQGPPPPARLFHYTKAAGFEGILRSRELRLTHFRGTNDDAEIKAADSLFRDLLNRKAVEQTNEHAAAMLTGVYARYNRLRAASSLDVHIGCFSEAADLAGQWQEYGDEGRGYCLEFDLTQLAALRSLVTLEPGEIARRVHTSAPVAALDLLEVVYRPVQRSILVHRALDAAVEELLKHISEAPDHTARITSRATTALHRSAAALACQFKEAKWAAEREWRLTLISPPGQMTPPVSIPFRDNARRDRTPLRAVVVGPCGPGIADVEQHLATLGHAGVPVSASKLSSPECAKAARR